MSTLKPQETSSTSEINTVTASYTPNHPSAEPPHETSPRATPRSSTTVSATHSFTYTYASNSHPLTSSFQTAATLGPLPTSAPSTDLSSPFLRRNTASVVGITALGVLLIAASVAWIIFLRRRRRQPQRPPSAASETSFFPDRFVSARSSFVEISSEDGLAARLSTSQEDPEPAGPQILITSATSAPNVSLRDMLGVVPVTTEPAEYPASCQASIIDGTDGTSRSPTHSRGSSRSTARQKPLANEKDMVWEEISVLEKRGSPQQAPRESEYAGIAERRIEELYARILVLEREEKWS
ncbi:hypothetical protein K438DRAFT_1964521 [Mycena galopus ATCC 62051]|nr:hypothetical protein K438DRAFT_1964521 [Mycena galopus ATCC 62051]